MSATLIGNNVTLKVNAAVSGSSSASSTPIYTAPASSYALLNVYVASGGGFVVGGVTVAGVAANTTFTGVVVGPGQTLATSLGNAVLVAVSGVSLINSP